jgi:hypothetical protein
MGSLDGWVSETMRKQRERQAQRMRFRLRKAARYAGCFALGLCILAAVVACGTLVARAVWNMGAL